MSRQRLTKNPYKTGMGSGFDPITTLGMSLSMRERALSERPRLGSRVAIARICVSAYLRRMARLLDIAEGRLVAVLTRCGNGARSDLSLTYITH